jgi:hypothetical protein
MVVAAKRGSGALEQCFFYVSASVSSGGQAAEDCCYGSPVGFEAVGGQRLKMAGSLLPR